MLAAHEHGLIAAAIESVQRRLRRCSHVPVLSIHRPLTAQERAAERAAAERPPGAGQPG